MPPTMVKVKCRNCGREASADDFKVHHRLRMAVCPTCYYGKGSPVVTPQRSAGAVGEEEGKLRIAKLKENPVRPAYEDVVGSEDVRVKCPDCKYTFRHDPYRKFPAQCPYCNKEVPRVRVW